MAERGNPEVKRTFDRLGGTAEKKTDLWNALKAQNALRGVPDKPDIEAGGHPDYTWLLPPMGGYIEAKAAQNRDGVFYFNLGQIAPKQRDWLNQWATISYLWLWFGNVPPDRVKDPGRRRAYLVPWTEWLRTEHILTEAGLSGLAYLQAHQLKHREAGLQAIDLLAAFELTWAGERAWDIPAIHPFWSTPLQTVPLFAYACCHPTTEVSHA